MMGKATLAIALLAGALAQPAHAATDDLLAGSDRLVGIESGPIMELGVISQTDDLVIETPGDIILFGDSVAGVELPTQTTSVVMTLVVFEPTWQLIEAQIELSPTLSLSTPVPVPAPAALPLLLSGVAGLVLLRRL